MYEELQEQVRGQAGVVTRAQARAHGVPLTQLGKPGSDRLLTRVRPNAYALTSRYDEGDPVARLVIQVAAERLVCGVDLVAVRATAAQLHEVPLIGPPPPRLQLGERKHDRPKHHGNSRALPPEAVVEVRAVPATSLSRTAVDLARARGHLAGVAAADAALRRGASPEELLEALEACARWPGIDRARRAVGFADGRAESALESLGRVRFDEQGLPPCDLQVVLGDTDGPIARVDHYWEAHRTIAEADGALKYVTAADLFAEKRREDRLREAGFEVVRYTWDEALRHPELVAVRIRQAFVRYARRAA
ncbi:MAG: hypothetical protein WD794_03950 [Mycobacteriales bacterium]